MKTSAKSLAALALTAVLGLGASGAAQAGNVYWSVGVAQPGVQIGVSSFPPLPVVVAPAPVLMAPRPVYWPVPPRVVLVPPPRPLFYGRPGFYGPAYRQPPHARWGDGRGRGGFEPHGGHWR